MSMSARGAEIIGESYAGDGPADVMGPGVGVVVRDGLALPFRLTDWDCSMYSNFRESRLSVTGP